MVVSDFAAYSAGGSLVFIDVFAGDVVFGDFVGVDLGFVSVVSVLDAFDNIGFEGVSFFEQFVHTLGIGGLEAGQSLQIAGLSARARCESFGCK